MGLSFEKILLLLVVAAIIIGPTRLPQYAAWLGRTVRQIRDMANSAKTRVKEEMGDEVKDIDWRKLDPRQYDPRRIVREALLEQPSPTQEQRRAAAEATAAAAALNTVAEARAQREAAGRPAPFDDDAT